MPFVDFTPCGQVSEKLPKTTAKDMFKNPDQYDMYFKTPNEVYRVKGQKVCVFRH